LSNRLRTTGCCRCAGLGVDERDQIAHVLRDQAKALLALSQPFLRAPVLGDVAKAPYAADRLSLDELRPGVAFEDAAVLELDGVEAFLPGMVVELAHLPAELLGVLELVEHVASASSSFCEESTFGGIRHISANCWL